MMVRGICPLQQALEVVSCDKRSIVRSAYEATRQRLFDVRTNRLNATGLAEFNAIDTALQDTYEDFLWRQAVLDAQTGVIVRRLNRRGRALQLFIGLGLCGAALLMWCASSLIGAGVLLLCAVVAVAVHVGVHRQARRLAQAAWDPTMEACTIIGQPESAASGPCGLYLRADALVYAVLGPLESFVEQRRHKVCSAERAWRTAPATRAAAIYAGSDHRYGNLQELARRRSILRDLSLPEESAC